MFQKIYNTKEKFIPIYLLPLLIIYIIIIIKFNQSKLIGDEGRYLWYSDNILKGFYSPPSPNIVLWNGPGYPLLLAGLKLFINELIFIRLINAMFLYLAVIYFAKTIRLYNVKPKKIILFSYLMGLANLYLLSFLPLILTEIFAVFLVSLIIYLVIKIYNKKDNLFLCTVILGFFIGYLALTKIIFGYVMIITMAILLVLQIFFTKYKIQTRLAIFTLLISLVTTLPYLIYTYKLTNKIFYWGNSGGLSLYWMSSPFKHELGDWYSTNEIFNRDISSFEELRKNDYFEYSMLVARDSILYKNHYTFFEKINKLNPIDKDKALKKQAIKNIYNNPVKFIINWLANIGRILFHYPFSYRDQTINTFIVLLPNMFLLCFMLLALIIAFIVRKKIPFEIYFLSTFFFIYFALSSLLSAYGRMFFPIYPYVFIFIIYIFQNFIKIIILKN